MRIEGPVDLPAVLQGGQAFRWRRVGAAWVGAIGARRVEFSALPGGAVDARASPRASRPFFERYLGLGPLEDARRARLAADPVLAPSLAAHPGLRILRQDSWETTVAFITSANNNVLRIERILNGLAESYGEPVGDDARAFPDATRLARVSEARLRDLGLGYRARFLRESARMVARGDIDFEALRGCAPADARAALMALPGVGPKVADCIALFSLNVTGAFPLDRWVHVAVAEAFWLGTPRRAAEVEAFARKRWGDDAGLAQQFLFHAVRLTHAAPGTGRLAMTEPT